MSLGERATRTRSFPRRLRPAGEDKSDTYRRASGPGSERAPRRGEEAAQKEEGQEEPGAPRREGQALAQCRRIRQRLRRRRPKGGARSTSRRIAESPRKNRRFPTATGPATARRSWAAPCGSWCDGVRPARQRRRVGRCSRFMYSFLPLPMRRAQRGEASSPNVYAAASSS